MIECGSENVLDRFINDKGSYGLGYMVDKNLALRAETLIQELMCKEENKKLFKGLKFIKVICEKQDLGEILPDNIRMEVLMKIAGGYKIYKLSFIVNNNNENIYIVNNNYEYIGEFIGPDPNNGGTFFPNIMELDEDGYQVHSTHEIDLLETIEFDRSYGVITDVKCVVFNGAGDAFSANLVADDYDGSVSIDSIKTYDLSDENLVIKNSAESLYDLRVSQKLSEVYRQVYDNDVRVYNNNYLGTKK